MKIEINLKIIFAILIFLLINNLSTYIIFLIFVLIHEFSHLIVGLILGGKPKRMIVSVFGVSLEFYSYVKAKSLYNGTTTLTSNFPFLASAFGSEPITSARPPVPAKGFDSLATNKTLFFFSITKSFESEVVFI